MSDLDELQAAGLEVSKLLQRLRNFHELFEELLCEASQEGFFLWVNSQWEKLTGWTADELTSKPWLEFVHPDDKEKTIAAADMMKYKGVANFENRYKHANGNVWLWLRWKTIAFNGTGKAYAKAEVFGTEPA